MSAFELTGISTVPEVRTHAAYGYFYHARGIICVTHPSKFFKHVQMYTHFQFLNAIKISILYK